MTEAERERAAIVSWLRGDQAWIDVVNHTMALHNGDVFSACRQIARMIENSTHLKGKE